MSKGGARQFAPTRTGKWWVFSEQVFRKMRVRKAGISRLAFVPVRDLH